MNLNCCIHSPALAAVKKQQQKPETNGVLIFSRICQSSPVPPFTPSLPPPLRHASAVKSAGVQGRLHSFLGQEAPRHLHKIWSLQTQRTPCVCVSVCATPPCTCVSGNCWLCLPTVYQKMKQKSNGSAKSSSRKYASVFVFYSYNNKSTVAASSGTVTAKTTAAVAVAVSSSSPPFPSFVVVALF